MAEQENENDDVMDGFGDEPPIPQEYEEPDIPSQTDRSDPSNTPENKSDNAPLSYGSDNSNPTDNGDYEGWEAETDDGEYEAEKQADSDDDNAENEQENEEEVSQSKKILDTEPSQKVDITSRNKNKGTFLNRQRILIIMAGIFVFFILFFTFVYPMISEKKKKEQAKELDKVGKVHIPQELNDDSYIYKTEQNENFVDSNSAADIPDDEDFEEKFPPILPQNKAPIEVPKTAATVEVPITNRNEQQKQPQRLALDKATSPTEQQRMAGYAITKPSGYNTGYNPSASVGGGSGSYTPPSLTSNMDRFLATQTGNVSSWTQQNNQSGKQEFMNKNGLGGNYQWNSEYSLWKGTIISAVLDTGINTDLPGSVMAHVTKNVFSSADGRYMLIPMGSRLYGEYNSDLSYGQNRVQVVWNTLIRPDGLEINLGSLNGIDAYGYSGYKGWKTEHPFEYVKAFGLIAMYSLLDTKANNLIDTQNNQYAQNVMTDVYGQTQKLANKIIDRALDIQPTNTIASGTEINLITNVTMDLPPLEPYEVEEKYVRY